MRKFQSTSSKWHDRQNAFEFVCVTHVNECRFWLRFLFHSEYSRSKQHGNANWHWTVCQLKRVALLRNWFACMCVCGWCVPVHFICYRIIYFCLWIDDAIEWNSYEQQMHTLNSCQIVSFKIGVCVICVGIHMQYAVRYAAILHWCLTCPSCNLCWNEMKPSIMIVSISVKLIVFFPLPSWKKWLYNGFTMELSANEQTDLILPMFLFQQIIPNGLLSHLYD